MLIIYSCIQIDYLFDTFFKVEVGVPCLLYLFPYDIQSFFVANVRYSNIDKNKLHFIEHN